MRTPRLQIHLLAVECGESKDNWSASTYPLLSAKLAVPPLPAPSPLELVLLLCLGRNFRFAGLGPSSISVSWSQSCRNVYVNEIENESRVNY